MTITKKISLLLALYLLLPCPFAHSGWEKPLQPPNPSQLQTLLPHPLDPAGTLVASHNEVFESSGERPWNSLWRLPGSQTEIRKLVEIKSLPEAVFILTSDGAFRGDLKNRRFEKIYYGLTQQEKSVLSYTVAAVNPSRWLMGTEAGLFVSKDEGKTWAPFPSFKNEPVPLLYFERNRLFVGTKSCLYVSDDLVSFRTVLSFIPGEEELTMEEESPAGEMLDEDNPGTLQLPAFHDLASSGPGKSHLWLAAGDRIFQSINGGLEWQALTQTGLETTEVRSLAYDEASGRLFAGTSRGAFAYSSRDKNWQEFFSGLDNTDIHALILSGAGATALEAVTGSGFFRYGLGPGSSEIRTPAQNAFELSPVKTMLFQKWLRLEPSFRELEKMILSYNDAGSEKISRWQKESRLRALVPTFYVSKSLSRGTSIDLDRGGTSDADKYILGPDDLTRSWNANVSWDLGDLIWSTAQTSIDSRSKLNTELRRDLLAEAARIYHERRRLAMQIVFGTAESDMAHMENLIRLDELTALLDSMSGGDFSQSLEKMYAVHPELDRLWVREVAS
jgi:photosystem II stability/assembly factor-like uncharacterized protein